ncbi:MAG: hypothetical protein A4E65_03514 [Syntrophorhabdus sp. PtaU1.Bin153]|nr:MAG: hypothetical protein A4E65_03514 [Syntrophorhabdus sp. PtaU1.Bin153]
MVRRRDQKPYSGRHMRDNAPRQSRKVACMVLDSLDAGVYVTDMDTFEILFINEYTRRIFGDVTRKRETT